MLRPLKRLLPSHSTIQGSAIDPKGRSLFPYTGLSTSPSPSTLKTSHNVTDTMSKPAAGQESKPARKRLKLTSSLEASRLLIAPRFEDKAIIIIAGLEKVGFAVHKIMICEISAFFSKSVCEESKEPPANWVTIPNVGPAIFSTCLQWLYSHSLPEQHVMQGPDPNFSFFSWSSAIKIYILSHFLLCPTFGNSILDFIRGRLNDTQPLPMASPNDMTEIYAQMPGDYGLRR